MQFGVMNLTNKRQLGNGRQFHTAKVAGRNIYDLYLRVPRYYRAWRARNDRDYRERTEVAAEESKGVRILLLQAPASPGNATRQSHALCIQHSYRSHP